MLHIAIVKLTQKTDDLMEDKSWGVQFFLNSASQPKNPNISPSSIYPITSSIRTVVIG
jgi:hypothetical protein